MYALRDSSSAVEPASITSRTIVYLDAREWVLVQPKSSAQSDNFAAEMIVTTQRIRVSIVSKAQAGVEATASESCVL